MEVRYMICENILGEEYSNMTICSTKFSFKGSSVSTVLIMMKGIY